MRRGMSLSFKVLLPCFLIIAGVFFVAPSVFAQVAAATSALGAAAGSAAAGSAATAATNLEANIITDVVINLVAQILNFIVAAIGKLTLVVIEMLIIPILNYNSFSSSPIIGIGWSLVRDIMNMFVIIALLFIAIFTIVGDHHRAHWEQQIPQLFIAVILMNFSRTICGILIDVSQVIMFTFVNALLDIAAGNFAQMFLLPDFGKFDLETAREYVETASSTNATENLLSAANNLAGAFLQIPLYGTILAIMFLLAIAFIYRIVVLWLLVILSPLAFFLGGIKGIFPRAGGAAGGWWGQFTGALVMGPMLAFFLWLALAAASSGSILNSEGFPTPETPQTYGLPLEVFDSSNLAAILVALALLVIGMQQAGQSAASIGGWAKDYINEGMGRKLVGATARLPLTALGLGAAGSASVGRRGLRTADRYMAPKGSLTLSEDLAKKAIGAGERMVNSGGIVGGVVGRIVMAKAGEWEHATEHSVLEDIKRHQTAIKNMGDDQKIARLNTYEKGISSADIRNRDEALVLSATLWTDANFEKKARDHYGDTRVDEIMKKSYKNVKNQQNLLLDESGKQKFNGKTSKYLDLLPEDEAKKFIDSSKFELDKLRDRPQVLDNPALLEALSQRVIRVDKGGETITALDQIRAGAAGVAMREKTKTSTVQDARSQQRYSTLLKENADSDRFEKALRGGNVSVVTMTAADLAKTENDTGKKMTSAIINSQVDVTNIGGGSPDARRQFVNNVMTGQDADTITKALRNGQVTADQIPVTAFDASNTNRLEVVKSVIQSKADMSVMPSEVQAEFQKAVRELNNAGQLSTRQAAEASAILLGARKDIENVIRGASVQDGKVSLNEEAKNELRRIFKADPKNVRYLADVPTRGSEETDLTQVVVESVTKDDLRKLAERSETAVGKELEEIKQALNAANFAIEQEYNASSAGRRSRSNESFGRLKELNAENQKIRSRLQLD